FIVFFFSSRRRHTRSKRDWSSDVCSSDLGYALCGTRGWLFDADEPHDEKVMNREIGRLRLSLQAAEPGKEKLVFLHYPPVYTGRSEERRVGKEGTTPMWAKRGAEKRERCV